MTVPRRRIKIQQGQAALGSYLAGTACKSDVELAVRFLLEEMAEQYPGNAVELRVPPLGAVQCIAGPSHKRGTPANVVELDPTSWLELALGKTSFEQLHQQGKLSASGNRSDLAGLFPIFVA